MRVLITGATGFVGRVLCEELLDAGHSVRAALHVRAELPAAVETVTVGDIGASTDWNAALEGVSAVVHLAARVHVLRDAAAGEKLYVETNAHGTRRLAQAAASHAVRRLVFLSSIKVNGEGPTTRGYTAADQPDPQDAYGRSKWLAEQSLLEVADRVGMEVAIVRSPLVYGPGVKANFLRLLRWVDRGLPLPLAAVRNRRSLVNVWNLCSLLMTLLTHPAANGRVWMVSDGEDLSTPDLVRRIALAMHRSARLIPVPAPLLRLGGRLTGRGDEVARLCDSLAVDLAQTRGGLGWSPLVSVDEGLRRTVDWYRTQSSTHAE